MIHSTVSPHEADAAQHQVDRLFSMLQQLLHDTIQWIATRKPQHKNRDEILRIWMGNGKDGRILRQVYGPLANGDTRNDLNPDRLRTLLDAFQEPATVGIDPAQYARRKPAIEVKIGDTTLFRQERDGVVTVNQIQLQRQVQQQVQPESQPSSAAHKELEDSVPESPSSAQELVHRDQQAQDMARIARYLMNPLGESNPPLLTKAQFQDFTLDLDSQTDTLTISKGGKPIVRDLAGQIENLGATRADWEVFHALEVRITQAPPSQQKQSPIAQDKVTSKEMTSNPAPNFQLAKVAEQQLAKIPNQPLQRLMQRILQSTANWLNQSLQHWQQITVAHTALRSFQQGHDRTEEEAYQMGDFTVSRQANNVFTLSDHAGPLMQFQNLSSGIKLMEISDRLTQPAIHQAVTQLSSFVPQGRHEVDYAFRVRAAEQTVREFLNYMQTPIWDYEQGKFRLELVDNQVLITSKQDGRGQIHGPEKVMQGNHREKLVPQPTRLTWKDLDHLDSIRDRLNARIAADQKRQIAPIPLQSVELNGKSHQVSQRSHQNGKSRALE